MASNVIEESQNTNRQSFAPHASKLIDSAKKITSYINKIKFFKAPLILQCIVNPTESGGMVIIFQLDDDNFSKTLFYNEESSFYPYNNANIQYVNATLGHRIGIFLFYLQLLLCYIMNIAHLTLENYTNDPLRAWLGIYKRFKVNMRHHNRSEFVGKTKEEKLHAAEHAMRLEMYADFLHDWSKDLVELYKKIASKPENYLNPKNPWEPTYLKHLNLFFQYIQSTFEAVQDLSWTIPQIKYSKSKSNTAIQHSLINKTRKQKPTKGGYLISKKSLGKMLRKQHRTRKHHNRKKHHSRKQHHSKKRQTLKRRSKRNSVSRRNKSKSYGGGIGSSKPSNVQPQSQPSSNEIFRRNMNRQDAMVSLNEAIKQGNSNKVEQIMMEHPDLHSKEFGFHFKRSNIKNNAILGHLDAAGFFNGVNNSNENNQ
jgi:hypothetical protein